MSAPNAPFPDATRQAPRDAGVMLLTMGDPAGIGLDISLLAWNERQRERLPTFALIADPETVEARASALGLQIGLTAISQPGAAEAHFQTSLPVLPISVRAEVSPGQPDTANAGAIIHAIEVGVTEVAEGNAAALVTNPIAKNVLYAAGFKHPGHTEFLAHLAEHHHPGQRYRPVMMLASSELKVVPVTIHIPLRDVPTTLTHDRIVSTGRVLADALRADFGVAEPKIAVCGLNPHAGEGGTIGSEDRDIIAPAIAELCQAGINATGPHSADTLFHAAARSRYDAAMAMYHDQALIPIKTLAFDTGVNITLGLPFVRTSPDHGTAFDLAGSGSANPASLIAALRWASQMAARRALSGTLR